MLTHSIRRTSLLLTLLAVLARTVGAALSAQSVSDASRAESAARIDAVDFRSSPVLFIENAGQWDDAARFQVWGAPARAMWLAEDAIWLTVVERSTDNIERSHVDTLERFDRQLGYARVKFALAKVQ